MDLGNGHGYPTATRTPEVRGGFGNDPPSEPRLGNPSPEVFGDPDPFLQALQYLRANP